eukprot:scaffold600776_cov59-Attheya_sp.AAC.1
MRVIVCYSFAAHAASLTGLLWLIILPLMTCLAHNVETERLLRKTKSAKKKRGGLIFYKQGKDRRPILQFFETPGAAKKRDRISTKPTELPTTPPPNAPRSTNSHTDASSDGPTDSPTTHPNNESTGVPTTYVSITELPTRLLTDTPTDTPTELPTTPLPTDELPTTPPSNADITTETPAKPPSNAPFSTDSPTTAPTMDDSPTVVPTIFRNNNFTVVNLTNWKSLFHNAFQARSNEVESLVGVVLERSNATVTDFSSVNVDSLEIIVPDDDISPFDLYFEEVSAINQIHKDSIETDQKLFIDRLETIKKDMETGIVRNKDVDDFIQSTN